MSHRLLVSGIGGAAGADAVAASKMLDSGEGPGVVIEVGRERPRSASILAPGAAKDLEGLLSAPEDRIVAKARGSIVFVSIDDSDRITADVALVIERAGEAPVALVAPSSRFREMLELGDWDEVAILPGESEDSPLARLVLEEAGEICERVGFVAAPGLLDARRALGGGRGTAGRRLASRSGQATPLVLGGVFALVLGAAVLVAISGAVTGKARAQRTADLSAMSAARSMKDDLPRLLAPPRLPNGLPNPAHMPKPVYLGRARLAAVEAAVTNGASPLAVSVRFPDSASYAPVTARVAIANSVRAGPSDRGHRAPPSWAEARVGAAISMGSVPSMASGGGYSGPLAERQGHGLRPDVAAAFDLMTVAANAAGVTLTINSAFRSDAEQAALFAANPDPTWVAPPGQSLHRCATELDLGPPSSYAWLAANAGRFGFVQRYSWEAWHYGG